MPSAAEPAHPEHTVGPPGNVVHLSRRGLRTGRGRRTPQPSVPDHAVANTPQQRLAETAEAMFLAQQSTLTDPVVADAYRTTLSLVQLMLDGSHAQQLIGEEEHQHLTAMVGGLKCAPGML